MKKGLLLAFALAIILAFGGNCCAKDFTVVEGDHFWKLSIRHDVDWTELQKINEKNLRYPGNPNLIFPGQVMQLPDHKKAHAKHRAATKMQRNNQKKAEKPVPATSEPAAVAKKDEKSDGDIAVRLAAAENQIRDLRQSLATCKQASAPQPKSALMQPISSAKQVAAPTEPKVNPTPAVRPEAAVLKPLSSAAQAPIAAPEPAEEKKVPDIPDKCADLPKAFVVKNGPLYTTVDTTNMNCEERTRYAEMSSASAKDEPERSFGEKIGDWFTCYVTWGEGRPKWCDEDKK